MFALLLIYSALLVLAVFSGVQIARKIQPTHRRTQMAMSFVSGLMLGIAVFHLLPHALYAADSVFGIGAEIVSSGGEQENNCLLYTSPSPRDRH